MGGSYEYVSGTNNTHKLLQGSATQPALWLIP